MTQTALDPDEEILEDILRSAVNLSSGDHIRKALLLRYVRAAEKMVRHMPLDLLMTSISAPTDLDALECAMIESRAYGLQQKTSSLEGAVGRSITHRLRLIDMAGEILSSSQLEDLFGIKRQAIDKRRKNHKLLAIRIASGWGYPAFQFREGKILPGLVDVLRAHAGKNPLVVLDILLAPDETLGGGTLLEAIQKGELDVIKRHIAQSISD